MPTEFVLCDVFADRPFVGNPLAVFLDADGIEDRTMLDLAREFGWSEITFVLARPDGAPRVRIWTPAGELPFAGHPTVGTAVVLAVEGVIPVNGGVLELGIGDVAVEVDECRPDGGRATMTQRAPEFGAEYSDRARLAQAFGLGVNDLVADLPAQLVSTGLEQFLVPLVSLGALQRATAQPDLAPGVLAEAGGRWAYLFTVETPASNAAARARLLGVGKEDPATGSAAGPLGAYLIRYGLHRAGELEIEQGIEMGRPSRIRVDVPLWSGEIGPVRVSGQVQIWGRGSRF
jgi:trans-2,3-dihydro-3-hydroxyanthranilate isomerase